MAHASLCLEGPLPIRQMITGEKEMTRDNTLKFWCTDEEVSRWARLDMKKKQQVKVYALQEYIAKADENVLDLFFDIWQGFWAKLYDA